MRLYTSGTQAYLPPNSSTWKGRAEYTNNDAYWYQIIRYLDLLDEKLDWSVYNPKDIVFLGYECDAGVKLNQGRKGAKLGPTSVRNMLGSLPNHNHSIIDAGNIQCMDNDLNRTHTELSNCVNSLLEQKLFPVLIGGGHDMAYAHYTGIRSYLEKTQPGTTIGIINLDAHFDLRDNQGGNNSGTPFYQIAQECKEKDVPFRYMCLGIQESSNPAYLFDTASELGVSYFTNEEFTLSNFPAISQAIEAFIQQVDHIYLTIDLDGFSSAYAPGVSAPSPLGFSPDVAIATIKLISLSGKLISTDIVELNPIFDTDNQTARLASKLVYTIADSNKV